ncbi:Ribosomal protein S21 family protein [Raphanus sativus]|uniref:30S ribosomal protein S21, chloroplastic-like n=1 Tax=Raphanus sativus TaxID=3726 RepID=A0A9W3CRN8_RAPSA|nr:30S ribosomal protein S21, chloroplastic-like [Raphanus sativus]KAJ4870414.1 Ribosomal protein S21 family protein [Raphanus sativus]
MASLSEVFSRLLTPSLSRSPPSPKPPTVTRPSHQLSFNNNNRVAYPSLANANLVFFKSGNYNVEVVPKDGESEEQLVNDFKRSVFRAGVLQETRRRRFFESSQEKRKRKTKEAAKKYRKRRPNPKPKSYSAPETPKSRREVDEDDDNWELPPEEIEIPYTNGFSRD